MVWSWLLFSASFTASSLFRSFTCIWSVDNFRSRLWIWWVGSENKWNSTWNSLRYLDLSSFFLYFSTFSACSLILKRQLTVCKQTLHVEFCCVFSYSKEKKSELGPRTSFSLNLTTATYILNHFRMFTVNLNRKKLWCAEPYFPWTRQLPKVTISIRSSLDNSKR